MRWGCPVGKEEARRPREDESPQGLGVGWRVPLLHALPRRRGRFSEHSSLHPSSSKNPGLLWLFQKVSSSQ